LRHEKNPNPNLDNYQGIVEDWDARKEMGFILIVLSIVPQLTKAREWDIATK
jgi:hypothetical protein